MSSQTNTPRRFTPVSQALPPFYVGVDLGGTNIKTGVIDDSGRPLAWHSIKTEPERGSTDAIQRMAHAVLHVVTMAGVDRQAIAGVGLGSPGTMDVPRGILVDPPNLPGWINVPIREQLSRQTGYPVTFANDANSAAYGEFWVGAGRDFRSLVLLTLGTGVGGGIIVEEQLVEGENSHGSECGHIIIDYRDDARLCPCGQRGHLEAYASATAVAKRAQEALDSGRVSLLTELAAGEPLSALLVGQAAEAGDALCLSLISETAMFLGVGVASLMHTIDPAGVLLGGAMDFGGAAHPLGRRFLEEVRRETARRAFPILAKKTPVDFAALGGDAGYIGAAGLARLAHRRLAYSQPPHSQPPHSQPVDSQPAHAPLARSPQSATTP